MKLPKRKHQITVVYKSGAKVHLRAKDFSATQYESGRREFVWDTPRPRPVLFGADDVAAVYAGKV